MLRKYLLQKKSLKKRGNFLPIACTFVRHFSDICEAEKSVCMPISGQPPKIGLSGLHCVKQCLAKEKTQPVRSLVRDLKQSYQTNRCNVHH
jgi:hypothetical protein